MSTSRQWFFVIVKKLRINDTNERTEKRTKQGVRFAHSFARCYALRSASLRLASPL